MTEEERRQIAQAFRDALIEAGVGSGGGRSRFASDPGSSGGSGAASAGLGSNIVNVTSGLGALATGAGLLASGFSQVTNAVGSTVQDFQTLSKAGLSFNNNAMLMNASIGQTRLSMDEYKAVMDKLSPSIAGLGGTVDQGARNFNKFSGEFMKTQFAEDLTKMGFTTRELNDVMAANMANRKFTDLSDENQRRKAIESTAALAREMDETAKLTGITRQEQMAELRKRTEDGKVQAAIMLEMAKGGKDVEQQYRNMNTSLQGLGKGVSDLADEMFTGGVRTKEGSSKMAALGDAGIQLQKAVDATKAARTPEEKEAAKLQLEAAKVAVNERMKSVDFLEAVTTSTNASGQASLKMLEENKLLAGTVNKSTTTGQTTGQAMAANKQAAINQQQGKDENGVKDEAAKTTELYIQALNRQRDVSALAKEGINDVNNALMRFPATAKAINTALEITKAMGPDGRHFADAGLQEAIKRLEAITGLASTPSQPLVGANGKTLPPNPKTDRVPSPGQQILSGLQGGLASIANWAGGVDGGVVVTKFLNGTTLSKDNGLGITSQSTGSKEVFGDWFNKDWGQGGISMLHGKEAVVPQEKLPEFLSDTLGKLMETNIKMPSPANMDIEKSMGFTATQLESEVKKMFIGVFNAKETKGGTPNMLSPEALKGMEESFKKMSDTMLLEQITTTTGPYAKLAEKVLKERDIGPTTDKKSPTPAEAKANIENPILALQKKLAEGGAKIKTDGIMGPETFAAMKNASAGMIADLQKAIGVPPGGPTATQPAPAKTTTTEAKPSTGGIPEAALSDVVKSLESLNMLMGELVTYAAETAEHGGKTVRATKSLNGNLYAR
jgi:hypothetical protein